MRSVVGLFGSVSSAENAVSAINASKISTQKAVILKEDKIAWVDNLVMNNPKQGAISGAVLGTIIGALLGLIVALFMAFFLDANIYISALILGAVLLGVVFAFIGYRYIEFRYTAHLQLFAEVVAEGGALVMIPIKDESGRVLEGEMRKYGAKLADTYQVHAEQIKRLRSEHNTNTGTPAGV